MMLFLVEHVGLKTEFSQSTSSYNRVKCQKYACFIASVCVDRGKPKSLQEKYGRVRTHRPCEHCTKLCFPKPVNMTEYFRTECSLTFSRMSGTRHLTSKTTDITHTVGETLVDTEGYTHLLVGNTAFKVQYG